MKPEDNNRLAYTGIMNEIENEIKQREAEEYREGKLQTVIKENAKLTAELMATILDQKFKSFSVDDYKKYRDHFENNRISYSIIAVEVFNFLKGESNDKSATEKSRIEEINEKPEQFLKAVEEHMQDGEIPKFAYKIHDHINLAIKQYNQFAEDEKRYEERFSKMMEPEKERITKEINSQLITLVGIFTAIAFMIFGGLSGLGSFFGMISESISKVLIVSILWALYFLNILSLMMYYVAKVTSHSIEAEEYAAKKTGKHCIKAFEKYPFWAWGNILLLLLLAASIALHWCMLIKVW